MIKSERKGQNKKDEKKDELKAKQKISKMIRFNQPQCSTFKKYT